ncbi:MAG: hypothetical protein AVDCRST_MAG01-01-5011, partial [uncultured Rubrobacteraceae bacterium]
ERRSLLLALDDDFPGVPCRGHAGHLARRFDRGCRLRGGRRGPGGLHRRGGAVARAPRASRRRGGLDPRDRLRPGGRRRRRRGADGRRDGDRKSGRHRRRIGCRGRAVAVGAVEEARSGGGPMARGHGDLVAPWLDGDVGRRGGRRAGLRDLRRDGRARLRGHHGRRDAARAARRALQV